MSKQNLAIAGLIYICLLTQVDAASREALARSLSLQKQPNLMGGSKDCPADTKLATVQEVLDRLSGLGAIAATQVKVGDIKSCSVKVVAGIITKFSIASAGKTCNFEVYAFLKRVVVNSADDLVANCDHLATADLKAKVAEKKASAGGAAVDVEFNEPVDLSESMEFIPLLDNVQPILNSENLQENFIPQKPSLKMQQLRSPTLKQCNDKNKEIHEIINSLKAAKVFSNFNLQEFELLSCSVSSQQPLEKSITIKKNGKFYTIAVRKVADDWKILNPEGRKNDIPELFEASFDPSKYRRVRI